MKDSSTESLWLHSAKQGHFPKLEESLKTQICIVGGGIAGMSTAYFLANQGYEIVLIEAGIIAHGETGCTTAHISSVLDKRYSELYSLHGPDNLKLIATSHMAAIDQIEEIVKKEKIECDFEHVSGCLCWPENNQQQADKELKYAREAGLKVKKLKKVPGLPFESGACLEFANQAQFQPIKYVNGLAEVLSKKIKIFESTQIEKVEGGKEIALITANGKQIKADYLVMATNSPIYKNFSINAKQAAYRTYVISCSIPAKSVPKMLIWDTLEPFHYVRIYSQGESQDDLLIVGGEDHKTGQGGNSEERFANLEKWARERFPGIKTVDFRWSGQVMNSIDGIGYLGQSPGDQNIFLITGDTGVGMTHTTIGAMIIADLIAGKANSWVKLYQPGRINLHAMGPMMKEGLNVAAQYCKNFTAPKMEEAEKLSPDSGEVVSRDGKKVAVYKDAQGKMQMMSAVCPHLGCLVKWNDSEKSWDCPCHGSRFEKTGKVTHGPATKDLGKIK